MKTFARVTFVLAIMAVLSATAFAQNKPQAHDPRIGQKESLALIGMDPVDVSYVTNYDTHNTGVLLVPSSGPLEGKGGLYINLSVPAGTLVDFPKEAKVEPFHFVAPNGEEADAVKVTIAPNTKAVVNACGNGHNPNSPMIMKLINVLRESTKTTVALIDYDAIRRAARETFEARPQEEKRPQPTVPAPPRRWCARSGWHTTACVVGGGIIVGGIVSAVGGDDKGPDVTTKPRT